MNHELEELKGRSFQNALIQLRPDVDALVLPVLMRRHWLRRAKVLSASCVAILFVSVTLLGVQSTENILKVRGVMIEYGPGPKELGEYASMPIEEFVEQSDHIVHVEVEEVKVDRFRLLLGVLGLGSDRVVMTLRLRVVKSYPGLDEEELVLRVYDDDVVEVGEEFLIGLRERANEISLLEPLYSLANRWGVYPVYDGNGESDAGRLAFGGSEMSLKDAWKLIRELRSLVHGDASASDTAMLRGKYEILKNGSHLEVELALQYLSVVDDAYLDDRELFDALEFRHERLFSIESDSKSRKERRTEVYEFRDIANRILERMLPVVSENVANRIVEIYIENQVPDGENRLLDGEQVFRIALKNSGEDRYRRVTSLLGKFVDWYDSQGRKISTTILVPTNYTSIRLIAKTSGDDMDRLLLEIFDGGLYDHLRDAIYGIRLGSTGGDLD